MLQLWHKDESHPESVRGMVTKMSPSVYTTDLKNLVCTRLDELASTNKLTDFHNDEVWIKVGGDHGGGSFKFCLQLLNTQSPNSKENTLVIGCFEGKDYYDNMKIFLNIFKEPLEELKQTQWCNKDIRIFVFGDYAFLTSAYGLSGAAGTYRCLWCLVEKKDLVVPQHQRATTFRTLQQIQQDHRQFQMHRSKRQHASSYHNVIHKPLLNIPLSHVCPPYLHILLGVVKLHHDLLESECHQIDKRIAEDMACSQHKDEGNKSLFQTYVDKLRKRKELRLAESETQRELDDESKNKEMPREDRKAIKHALRRKLQTIEKQLHILEEETTLSKTSGPITSNLENILQKHHITVQAFHSRSFIGNHCAKCLRETTYTDLLNSIDNEAKKYTQDQSIITDAETTSYQFLQINKLFSQVHTLISHSQPIQQNEIDSIKLAISEYLAKFRQYFPQKFPPKLHFLEDHLLPWIERWGFGMTLMGEQGGEACHKEFNRLARTMHGIADPLERLTAMMEEHVVLTHPTIQKHILHPRKRKL